MFSVSSCARWRNSKYIPGSILVILESELWEFQPLIFPNIAVSAICFLKESHPIISYWPISNLCKTYRPLFLFRLYGVCDYFRPLYSDVWFHLIYTHGPSLKGVIVNTYLGQYQLYWKVWFVSSNHIISPFNISKSFA